MITRPPDCFQRREQKLGEQIGRKKIQGHRGLEPAGHGAPSPEQGAGVVDEHVDLTHSGRDPVGQRSYLGQILEVGHLDRRLGARFAGLAAGRLQPIRGPGRPGRPAPPPRPSPGPPPARCPRWRPSPPLCAPASAPSVPVVETAPYGRPGAGVAADHGRLQGSIDHRHPVDFSTKFSSRGGGRAARLSSLPWGQDSAGLTHSVCRCEPGPDVPAGWVAGRRPAVVVSINGRAAVDDKSRGTGPAPSPPMAPGSDRAQSTVLRCGRVSQSFSTNLAL